MAGKWMPIESAPEGVEVMTRIDDLGGVRNEQSMVRKGRLWWLPDGSMYVYYSPTHWQPLARATQPLPPPNEEV